MQSNPVTAISHELLLGQQPLQALSQQQRATFHWLLATLPADLTRHAELESHSLTVPALSNPLLAQLQGQCLPLNRLFAADDDWLKADEHSQTLANDGLAQCRLLQTLQSPPLVPYHDDHSRSLPADVTTNLAPWQQQRQQPLPAIPALPAILELAAQAAA